MRVTVLRAPPCAESTRVHRIGVILDGAIWRAAAPVSTLILVHGRRPRWLWPWASGAEGFAKQVELRIPEQAALTVDGLRQHGVEAV
jgi:hypothetical protein